MNLEAVEAIVATNRKKISKIIYLQKRK